MTPKQTRFVAEYLANGMNATKAYKSAGYAAKNANVSSSQLLANPSIAEAIAEITRVRLAKLEITADRILQELAKLAFFDVRDLFASDGSLLPIHKLSRNAAAGIAGFELTKVELPIRFLGGIRLLGRLEGEYSVGCRVGLYSVEERKHKQAQFDEIYALILHGMTR